jgi:LPS O-antigen subunit length determinant protein (WzzB/FepE family)
MKKNNTYFSSDEIDLGDIVKLLCREKVLILSISIICGLAAYLYASFQSQEFKTEVILKDPPPQLFEPYNYILNKKINNNNNSSNNSSSSNNNNINNINNINNNNVVSQFISDFKLNFLSLDNLQSFVEESRELDNFKAYLKSRNISAKRYFVKKINVVQEKDLIIPNKYSLVFTKELDGDIFLNNYVQFVKKKTLFEIKENLKLSIENKIIILENALENAKLINLENPILKSLVHTQVVNEPDDLFYKGSKILSQEIIYLKRLLIKLEREQFNFELISEKPLNSPVIEMLNFVYFVTGLMLGLFLSLGIIFFKSILKNS